MYPPSYPPADPFLRKEKNASPLPLHSFPLLLSRSPCYLFDHISSKLPTSPPLLPPRKKNALPSFLLQKKTIPLYLPSLLYTAAVVMEAKTHVYTIMCQGEREREKRTLPLLWRHPVAPPRMSTPQQCSNMPYINWNMRWDVAAAILQSQTNPHTIQSTLHTNHRQRILVISQSL